MKKIFTFEEFIADTDAQIEQAKANDRKLIYLPSAPVRQFPETVRQYYAKNYEIEMNRCPAGNWDIIIYLKRREDVKSNI